MPTIPANLYARDASKRAPRVIAAIALLAVAVLLPARANPDTAEVSGAALLARLTDPVAALAPLPKGARVTQFSSHDRQGGNIDGGEGNDAVSGDAGTDTLILSPGDDTVSTIEVTATFEMIGRLAFWAIALFGA